MENNNEVVENLLKLQSDLVFAKKGAIYGSAAAVAGVVATQIATLLVTKIAEANEVRKFKKNSKKEIKES